MSEFDTIIKTEIPHGRHDLDKGEVLALMQQHGGGSSTLRLTKVAGEDGEPVVILDQLDGANLRFLLSAAPTNPEEYLRDMAREISSEMEFEDLERLQWGLDTPEDFAVDEDYEGAVCIIVQKNFRGDDITFVGRDGAHSAKADSFASYDDAQAWIASNSEYGIDYHIVDADYFDTDEPASMTVDEQILAAAQALQGDWGKSLTAADIARGQHEAHLHGEHVLDGRIIKTADGGEVVMTLMVMREFSGFETERCECYDGATSVCLRVIARPVQGESTWVYFDTVAAAESFCREQVALQGGSDREVALREYRRLEGVEFANAPITLDGKPVPKAVADVVQEFGYCIADLSTLAAKYIGDKLCAENDERGLNGWTVNQAMAVLDDVPELRDLLNPTEAAHVRARVAESWKLQEVSDSPLPRIG